MVKPENIVNIRIRPHSKYKDYTLRCEDCGCEYHRAMVNAKTVPVCRSCNASREKIRVLHKEADILKAEYQKGYEAGFADAVKAYKERDEMIQ